MLRLLKKGLLRTGLMTGRCPVCGVLVQKGNGTLCARCASALSLRRSGYCPGCGKIFDNEGTLPTLCGECRTDPPPWNRLHFHSIYDGLLRELILGYKFANGLGRTRLLAGMACAAHAKDGGRAPDLIVPVPLHRKRLLWRGYNQSAELCRLLSRRLNSPVVPEALARVRHTRPQTSLGMVERRENIKAAFAADPAVVAHRTILLVDDVYTTGATLKECARTLTRAGAAGVDVLVLARTMV